MKRNSIKKLRRIFAICLLPFPFAHADEVDVVYGFGMRNDDLRWSIATDLIGTPPNVLSELSWRNLKGSEHLLGVEYISSSGWMGRANLSMAEFNQGGEVQDSDYRYDNRNGEFSRSLSSTHGSKAENLTLIAGHRFYIDESQHLSITPVIGLSNNVIDLHMNDGVQIIAPIGLSTGAFAGLDSRYRSQFASTMAGMEARWWFSQPFGMDLKWQHHWFTYHAEADWNMRTDFAHPVSFNQDGAGVANHWSLSALARLNQSWMLELSHSIRTGTLQNGKDALFLANGTQEHTLLREVEWSSTATSLLMHYTF